MAGAAARQDDHGPLLAGAAGCSTSCGPSRPRRVTVVRRSRTRQAGARPVRAPGGSREREPSPSRTSSAVTRGAAPASGGELRPCRWGEVGDRDVDGPPEPRRSAAASSSAHSTRFRCCRGRSSSGASRSGRFASGARSGHRPRFIAARTRGAAKTRTPPPPGRAAGAPADGAWGAGCGREDDADADVGVFGEDRRPTAARRTDPWTRHRAGRAGPAASIRSQSRETRSARRPGCSRCRDAMASPAQHAPPHRRQYRYRLQAEGDDRDEIVHPSRRGHFQVPFAGTDQPSR